MLYSEMVATKSAIHGDREKILGFRNEEQPVALQVGGSDKKELAQVAKLAEEYNYKEINFEDLLSYVSFIVDYYYTNKIHLTVKHRDNTFYLNQSQNSYHQILKYLANVKN